MTKDEPRRRWKPRGKQECGVFPQDAIISRRVDDDGTVVLGVDRAKMKGGSVECFGKRVKVELYENIASGTKKGGDDDGE